METDYRDTNEELRGQAIRLLRKENEFRAHLLAYVLINAFLVGVWAVMGVDFFWPVFPIMGWGIGVAFNAWDVYQRQPPTEERITREMESLRRRRR